MLAFFPPPHERARFAELQFRFSNTFWNTQDTHRSVMAQRVFVTRVWISTATFHHSGARLEPQYLMALNEKLLNELFEYLNEKLLFSKRAGGKSKSKRHGSICGPDPIRRIRACGAHSNRVVQYYSIMLRCGNIHDIPQYQIMQHPMMP